MFNMNVDFIQIDQRLVAIKPLIAGNQFTIYFRSNILN